MEPLTYEYWSFTGVNTLDEHVLKDVSFYPRVGIKYTKGIDVLHMFEICGTGGQFSASWQHGIKRTHHRPFKEIILNENVWG